MLRESSANQGQEDAKQDKHCTIMLRRSTNEQKTEQPKETTQSRPYCMDEIDEGIIIKDTLTK